MGYFEYYQARQGKGYSEVKKPVYDKRIWNDEGSAMKSPTIKSTIDMGVSIAMLAVGAGPWVSMLVNLADDAVFTALDVSGGYKTRDQGLLEFGKKAGVGIVTTAMGGAFGTNDAFGKASGFLGMAKDSGIIAKTLFGGMQNILTNTASNAINAIELDKAGKLVWNDDSFLEGTLGKSAMASYASGMASSFTTGALDTQLRGFGGNTYTGGLRLDALAGSLVGQGVDYAMTGNATLNLANFDMFGFKDKHGKVISSGLLEMHIGDAGLSMNMGMGGADLSYGSIAGAMGGFKAWGVNAQLALSSQEEARKYRVAMRTLSSTGSASDSALYEELLAGKTNIEDDSSGNYSAHTTVANGQRTIHLGSDRSILTSDLSMGVLLSHEGYRNGLDDGEEGQLDETGRAIRGHVGTAAMLEATYGKGVLGGQMSEELAALASGDDGRIAQAFGRYDSSSDYWKLTKDGKLKYDGKGKLVDELNRPIKGKDGKQLGANGIETGLISILLGRVAKNEEETRAVQQLMIDSGLAHSPGSNPKDWSWNLAANSQGEIKLNKAMDAYGTSMASAVFAAYFDTTADTQIAAKMGKGIGQFDKKNITAGIKARYDQLVSEKTAFYSGMQSFIGLDKGFHVSSPFSEYDSAHYDEFRNYHYGLDLGKGGIAGDSVYAGISGIVDDKGWNTGVNGNDLRIEYAFKFEGNTIGTGIYGEYMHMLTKSPLIKGSYVSGNMLAGQVGSTGSASSAAHLHYDIYTIGDAYSKSAASLILGKSYSSGQNSLVSKNDYWSSTGYGGYSRTAYNPELFYKNQWNYSFKGK